ncbi:MAG: phosphoribosylglycinamide formyltransferase [Armatimonadetes bacterium]|nr:phosphoribosylglycinamide formyltransferase [Armatimonadota bacterium]
MSINIAVMISGHGRGSNLQAIIDACKDGRIDGRVAVVIGVKDDAPAMQRARDNGIPAVEVRPKEFDTDEGYGRRIMDFLSEHQVDLICLAGYMRILPLEIVKAYRARIMNTHAALIPSFCGKGMYGEHVHNAVIEYGAKVSGCTIHFVDEQYDTGPIIIQKCVPVEEGDTPETLAARILPLEHQSYVEAVQLFAQGRLKVEGRIVRVLPSV